MKATIITIGDEILIGQIVDTNAVFISQRLNDIGCVVAERRTIGDGADQITSAIREALSSTDLVIVTGGLGPTKDDITKHTLAKLFDSVLVNDERVARHVQTMVESRGMIYNILNQQQSLVPECCEVLFNAHGTAPGMWFTASEGGVVVSLPGVPFEMKNLMDDEVLPRLKERFTLSEIVHRTMITVGVPESQLAIRIEGWEDALPGYLKLAYLPSPGRVRLRLSAYEVDGECVASEIELQFLKLEQILGESVLGYQDASVEELLHNYLVGSGLKIAVAESCTGGAIASKFTAMAGASDYFMSGVVSYSNHSKEVMLGVESSVLESYGAVSEQVACQMAEGVRLRSGADYAVSTTGIAGPTGGSPEKPVGTVWFGVATPNGSYAKLKNCGTDRSQIIARATMEAITMIKDEIFSTKAL
ncbi:MAG: competence/damage-inducible protein A [Rikenellaceae bacterium]